MSKGWVKCEVGIFFTHTGELVCQIFLRSDPLEIRCHPRMGVTELVQASMDSSRIIPQGDFFNSLADVEVEE